MFNFSKNTAEAFFERSSPLFGSLKNANSYLAHKSNDKKIADETLTQHLDLVVDFAKRIIKANRLDTALDKLIEEIVKQNFQEEHFEKGFDWLKNLFCKTILYHDHGKINLNFQGLEKKMNNALYKSQVDSNSPIDSQHSKPGAYIFLVSQFDAIDKSDFSGSEKRFLHLCSMLFGYNILKHHASYLNESWEIKDKFKIEEVDFMMPYLDEYQVVVKSVFREDFCKVLKKFGNYLARERCFV